MGRLTHLSYQVLLLVVMTVLVGCNQTIKLETPTQISITSNPTLSSPVTEPSDKNTCAWPPIRVSVAQVSKFFWSEDGDMLTYQEKGGDEKWYSYDPSTQEQSIIYMLTATPSSPELETYTNYFIAPNKKSIVYTQPNQDSYSVYSKKQEEKAAIYLGNIKGSIDQSVWLDEGNRLILSIDWASPLGAPEAYVYLIDISQKKVKVVIPHSPDHQDISLVGITPGQNKLLFTSYSGTDRLLQLWDIKDNSTMATGILAPLTLKWLPYKDEFMAAGYQKGSPMVRLFTYNLNNGSLRYLLPTPINSHPYIKDAVQISPNLGKVAFIDEENQNLYLIDCKDAIP